MIIYRFNIVASSFNFGLCNINSGECFLNYPWHENVMQQSEHRGRPQKMERLKPSRPNPDSKRD